VRKNNEILLTANQHQTRFNFVQYRLTPYFLILLFAAAMTILRIYIITEWKWYMHVFSFFGQTVVMIGIWNLVKWLNHKLEKRVPFEEGPIQRMFIQVMLTLLIVSPIAVTGITFARPYLPAFVNMQFLAIMIVLFVLMIFLFNFSFYAGYFFKNWQKSLEEKGKLELEAVELEKEKSKLQYHQLRNQVNPHYLFNMLSSLDGLIQTQPELASEFVRHMAKVYRYVLQHKENEVVNLQEELEFLEHYIQLLKVRYKESLAIHCNISEPSKECGIVMVTLQMLIDNAIKHNVLQTLLPLKIVIWDEAGYLCIHNNKQLRKQIETSNNEGLKQLKQLYSFLTDKQIIIENTEDHFTVKIPLL
jgi:two-component system, LytTR family, sensor kinase